MAADIPVEGKIKSAAQHACVVSSTRDLTFPYYTMSSRHDYRRRDRSWERDDRDKGRDRDRDRDRDKDRDRDRYSRRKSSRSRSPRRSGTDSRRSGMSYQSTLYYDGLNCATDRREYGRDRNDDRRDRDSRRRDERDRRDAPRRDGEKDRDRYERDKRDGEKGRDAGHEAERVGERGTRVDSESRETGNPSQSHGASLFLRLTLIGINTICPAVYSAILNIFFSCAC
jgi:hypothetical protein